MWEEMKILSILKIPYEGWKNMAISRLQQLILIILLINMLFLLSCLDMSVFKNKMSVDKLIIKYGQPDVVEEEAGDMRRFYRYNSPLEYVWPDAETKYYYLKKEIYFILKKGYVIGPFDINEEQKELLMPFIKGEI